MKFLKILELYLKRKALFTKYYFGFDYYRLILKTLTCSELSPLIFHLPSFPIEPGVYFIYEQKIGGEKIVKNILNLEESSKIISNSVNNLNISTDKVNKVLNEIKFLSNHNSNIVNELGISLLLFKFEINDILKKKI